MLYLVATPIGNLEDITIRAIKTLSAVELILAEDTRKTKNLLDHYKIKKPVLSFYDHNKESRLKSVKSRLLGGEEIALVTSAGTPGISDPGFLLIKNCVKENIPFTSVPGATACVNALILSGLPTDRFFFAGFLSPKKAKRDKQLQDLSLIQTTLIIFVSRHKIKALLQDIKTWFRDKRVSLLREMTKVYEEVLRGKPEDLISKTLTKPPKGEIVVIIDNRQKK
jgi:16S rRNA (cytidine1402-2'-O)-methyltransferase